MNELEFAKTLKTYASAVRRVAQLEKRIHMGILFALGVSGVRAQLATAERECERLYEKLVKAYGETR